MIKSSFFLDIPPLNHTIPLQAFDDLGTFPFLGRAGFAHQGSREMRLLNEHKAFSVSPFVLRSIMQGQYWPEGDRRYHAQIVAPTLLIYGFHDEFVTIDDGIEMATVSPDESEPSAFKPGSGCCDNEHFNVTKKYPTSAWKRTDLLFQFFFFYTFQTLPNASLKIVEEGGHMLMLECPDVVNSIIIQFFLADRGGFPLRGKQQKIPPERTSAPESPFQVQLATDGSEMSNDPEGTRWGSSGPPAEELEAELGADVEGGTPQWGALEALEAIRQRNRSWTS